MDIKTKFNFGDKVIAIKLGSKDVIHKCDFCDGLGYFSHKEEKLRCHKCNGEGVTRTPEHTKWFVPTDRHFYFTIHRIGMELYSPQLHKNNKRLRSWIYCMAANSGTLFNENDCFSTMKEAQAECDRRNNDGIAGTETA